MEGVQVADGTIVAAEANVVKNTIVGGNPAKVICYRFDEEQIELKNAMVE